MLGIAKKPFRPKAHCGIDYGFVATLFSTPSLLDFKGSARTLCYLFGSATGVLTALTNQLFAWKRVVSFRVHEEVGHPFRAHVAALTLGHRRTQGARRPPLLFLVHRGCPDQLSTNRMRGFRVAVICVVEQKLATHDRQLQTQLEVVGSVGEGPTDPGLEAR